MTALELAALLERSLRGLGDEMQVQGAIDHLLRRKAIAYSREVTLSRKDRIDFLVGDVGLEVKVQGSVGAVIRQLERYALSDRLASLVLVTTKVTLSRVPTTMNGKPVHVAAILAGIV